MGALDGWPRSKRRGRRAAEAAAAGEQGARDGDGRGDGQRRHPGALPGGGGRAYGATR